MAKQGTKRPSPEENQKGQRKKTNKRENPRIVPETK